MIESPRLRSLVKTLTWRVVATIDTFVIAWWITGRWNWAAGIAGLEVITKMILYYSHERVWEKVRWLKPVSREEHTRIFPFRD